jgi:DNA-directed RNA polymerase specialized sigma24 family protein
MSGRLNCCCPVCELEHALLSELNEETGKTKYDALASQSSVLSAFPTANDLLRHLRQSHSTDSPASESDEFLGELVRLSRNPHHEIGRHLVLLIIMPAIHKTSSQIVLGFPSLTRDDIAQHILTCVLDIVSSPMLRAQTSHFAFAITRAMRRSAFRWAIREADLALPSNLEGTSLDEFSAERSSSFESAILLEAFLSRCVTSGLLTPAEHELLLLFKIQGVSSEVLAAKHQLSDVAFRHRMQRVIDKLRRAARRRTVSSQSASTAVA